MVPGRATAAVGRMATRVAVSFPPTPTRSPAAAFVSGTPIRSFAGVDRQAARRPSGSRPTTACCSSSAVRRRSRASPMPWRRHWSGCWPTGACCTSPGRRAWHAAQAIRASLGGQLAERYQPIAYLTDRMADALVASDLVLGRAGLLHLRRGDRRGRGLDPGPVSICRRAPARQRRLPGRPRGRGDAPRRGARRGAPGGRGHAAARRCDARQRWLPLPLPWACRTPHRRSPPSCSPWARAGRCPRWPEAPPDGRGRRRDGEPVQPRRPGRRASVWSCGRTPPLAPLTTLRVGGPADRLADARDRDGPAGPAAGRPPGRGAGLRAGQRQRPGGGRCRASAGW